MNLSAISLWTTREDHQFFLSRRSLLSFTPRGFGRCNAKSAPLEMRTKKKKTTTPRAASSSSSFVVFPRAQTGTRNFFLVRVGACEIQRQKGRSFFGIIGGGRSFSLFVSLFFFVICILDVSVSLPTQNERLFVKARLCDFCGGRRRF